MYKSCKAVILDDNKNALELFENHMRGIETIKEIKTYDSPHDFQNDLKSDKLKDFTLFLIDIEMPELDKSEKSAGEILAREIKARHPHSRLIFISGYSKRGSIFNKLKNEGIVDTILDKFLNEREFNEEYERLSLESIELFEKNELDQEIDLIYNDIMVFSNACECKGKDREYEITHTKYDLTCLANNIVALTTTLTSGKNDTSLVTEEMVYCLKRKSLTGLIMELDLESKGFLKISGSTIINTKHIDKTRKDRNLKIVYMSGGNKFDVTQNEKPLSRLY